MNMDTKKLRSIKETIEERIDSELLQAMSDSPWMDIPYEKLMATNPLEIRNAETKLALKEGVLEIPEDLIVKNKMILGLNNSPAIRLRIYQPKNILNAPVMLYFHGGAFIFGTPEQLDFVFYRLAIDTQMVIVSVDYRLAPEHPFPAAIEDGYAALLWIAKHGNEIDADVNKIIVGGSSAGGTLALGLTHMARDLQGSAIAFQYLLYPPTDNRLETVSMIEFAHAPMQTMKSAAYMWNYYLGNNKDTIPDYAVPLRQQNFSNLPPASVIVCELDPLRDEAVAYAEKLRDANGIVELIEVKGAIHAFDFFSCKLSDDFYLKQVAILKNAVL